MAPMHTGNLILLGAAILGGILGATLFQRLRIPQVIGYIAMGLIIGETGFGWATRESLAGLETINLFALAVIGFLVGGELRVEVFRQYGRQFFAVLLGEGFGAFLLVGLPVGALVYAVTGEAAPAAAAGLVFGAIASATDPASTMDVLWEYRARGVVTTTIIAVIALDDALAMALYALGTSLAQIIAGQSVSVAAELGRVALEFGGACVLGGGLGAALAGLLRHLHQPEKGLALAVGALLLSIGVCAALGLDVILAAMLAGAALANLAPLRSRALFDTVRAFATPIYVLFFVFVGARLSLGAMPGWLWGVVAVYLAGRTVGKVAGTWIGGRLSGADPGVNRYAGLGLFAQGGIAVGLSIMAGERLRGVPLTPELGLGEAVVFCVTATTFLMQVIGPNLIKLSARLAGELGRNVTEEDVVAGMRVADVIDTAVTPLREHDPVTHVVACFTAQPHTALPVLDAEGRVAGYVALDHLKGLFADQEMWAWLLARDVMRPVPALAESGGPLRDALETMRDLGVEQMLAVDAAGPRRFAGILDTRRARKRVQEALARRQSAA